MPTDEANLTPEEIIARRAAAIEAETNAQRAREAKELKQELKPMFENCLARYLAVTQAALERIKRRNYEDGQLITVPSGKELAAWTVPEFQDGNDEDYWQVLKLASDGAIYRSDSEDRTWRLYLSYELIKEQSTQVDKWSKDAIARYHRVLNDCEYIFPEPNLAFEPGREPRPPLWRRLLGIRA